MRTLVLGLGNPILGDDGIGIRVAAELKKRINDENVEVEDVSSAGFNILDMIQGYEKVIVIDSIQTRDGRPGQLYRLTPSDFESSIHLASPHDINFATALALGRKLQMKMPKTIKIYAIEIKDHIAYAEKCTSELLKVIPEIVAEIMTEEFKVTKE